MSDIFFNETRKSSGIVGELPSKHKVQQTILLDLLSSMAIRTLHLRWFFTLSFVFIIVLLSTFLS